MTNSDRRTQPRVEWVGEAVAAFGAHEVRLRTRDLSIGGCCVETPWQPPAGQRVGIVLQLDGAPIGAWAEVAWATVHRAHGNDSYLWGLRFVELEHDCRVRLGAFVDHCLAVDMLDEMLRDAQDEPAEMAFALGELDEIPTRIFQHTPATSGATDATVRVAAAMTHRPTFFPLHEASAFEGEATSEIDVESTLTSEPVHTRTVQVDLAGLYHQAASAESGPIDHVGAVEDRSRPDEGTASWDASGPDAIGLDGEVWGTSGFVSQSTNWDDDSSPARREFVIEPLAAEPSRASARSPARAGTGTATARPAPLPGPDTVPIPVGPAELAMDAGDPFWVEPAPFPTRSHASWQVTPQAPIEAFAAAPEVEANAYAKATPFHAPVHEPVAHALEGFGPPTPVASPQFDPAFAAFPNEATITQQAQLAEPVAPVVSPTGWYEPAPAPTFAAPTFVAPVAEPAATLAESFEVHGFDAVDPSAFDAQALDPAAFEPNAFGPPPVIEQVRAAPMRSMTPQSAGPAPITGPHPILEPTPEITPLSADALLDLKRKRVDALLSSVPRRAATNRPQTADNAKDTKAAERTKARARPVDPDSGLRRLFDQALRDIKSE